MAAFLTAFLLLSIHQQLLLSSNLSHQLLQVLHDHFLLQLSSHDHVISCKHSNALVQSLSVLELLEPSPTNSPL